MGITTPFIVFLSCFFVTALLVLSYLATHVAGLVRLLSLEHDTREPDRPLLIAWAASFAAGFTGPLCIVVSGVSLVLALRARKRCSDKTANRIALRTTVLANAALLTGVVVVVVGTFVYGLSLPPS